MESAQQPVAKGGAYDSSKGSNGRGFARLTWDIFWKTHLRPCCFYEYGGIEEVIAGGIGGIKGDHHSFAIVCPFIFCSSLNEQWRPKCIFAAD